MTPIQPLPFDASLEQYAKQANELLDAYQLNDDPATPTKAVARQSVARYYGFENWLGLETYTRVVNEQRAIWEFESAIDAIIQSNTTQLKALLLNNPALIRMRSMRMHGAMLLHYVGANGVEKYRQQSSATAIIIAELLLKAGTEVDALANIYGKSTTLDLVATSIHSWQAGVQASLIETLLNYGASVDGAPGNWSPLQSALANGQREVAQTLAQHGARIDSIVTAAGLGRLDLVQYFFCRDNLLRSEPTGTPPWGISKNPRTQAKRALRYACLYDHKAVAEFLMAHGVDAKAGEVFAMASTFLDS